MFFFFVKGLSINIDVYIPIFMFLLEHAIFVYHALFLFTFCLTNDRKSTTCVYMVTWMFIANPHDYYFTS